ncbi:RdgB/HAM1 family non-canonical purine NTP pyrophosphatase [Syntrophorhabdus aromaticivorans]|uniref:dITP/XTP pyrophosphatase n=1 Tax=Syntrophorhabdus aromaticivorans TaxID=328301 RepID=A0A351U3C6_9BACT|nr:RdgB/HAM1 family non-canonical purine NTP pyrophosphatase [Syntrophorhabdus aromaticivorans]NLW35382.1 RdgB/HAM1 family non-canonical purine NTP pyrophosphatase [Syntrophorhabdus aromaticivorans]HBA54457.1 non-canonical purine NTP pyrophosphatase, RdgB/HAM1 family [Syntrophorhabdus aromaticivorans]
MRSIVIATENLGKFKEIRTLLVDEFDVFHSLRDFEEKVPVDEDSLFYIENAMKKARKVGDRFGMYTMADDSGLEVEALGGRPGVRSSRYGRSDEERIERLLAELNGVPWEKRGAVFRAYLAFYLPEKQRCYVFYGELRGIIGFKRKGEGGFGFDPVFYVPEWDRYLAEMTLDEKNVLSHRGRAIRAFKDFHNIRFFRSPRVQSL